MSVTVIHADSRDALREMADESVDSCVCDPPYALVSIVKRFGGAGAAPAKDRDGLYKRASAGFMGKTWDTGDTAFDPAFWAEVLRVLKPGGHLIAFGGTRTYHRLVCAIEDSGFEIRDQLAWLFGSGFPKSHDVSKAIDRATNAIALWDVVRGHIRHWRDKRGWTNQQLNEAIGSANNGCGMARHWTSTEGGQHSIPSKAQWRRLKDALGWPDCELDAIYDRVKDGAERPVIGEQEATRLAVAPGQNNDRGAITLAVTAPATDAAKQWQGWGSALKPAWETVCVASKPFPPNVQHARLLADLERLEARLWCLSFVNAAGESSASSRSDCAAAAFATAQWSADDATNTRDALCAQMDTSLFALALTSSLSTVSSWKRVWADDWTRANTSTTETESSTTTDWKTLRYCLSGITPQSIIQAHSQPNGPNASAHRAVAYFDAFASRLSATRTLSALDLAISQEATASQAGVASGPNLEPICLARKPLIGTVAANVLQHGTGALNIDASRIGYESQDDAAAAAAAMRGAADQNVNRKAYGQFNNGAASIPGFLDKQALGRWPANVIHDGSEEVLRHFPETDGQGGSVSGGEQSSLVKNAYGARKRIPSENPRNDTGSAARFFYTAKADADDRLGSKHPTVKPVDLMAYLVKLVTPPHGTVLDPFAGSGTTAMACMREGFRAILIEREAEYVADIKRRLAHVRGDDTPLFSSA